MGSVLGLRAAVVAGVVAAAVLAAALLLYTPDRARAVLEARYGGAYLAVAGMRLRVVDEGRRDAPAVVLLHGFGASLQTWDGWAALLAPDHRVIRFDLPGFGLTGADPTGDYSDARGMEVLGALLDGLGVARASLIGNSLGGKLAWEFAAAHPERVDRLVLISPDGFASPGFAYGTAPKVPVLAQLLPFTLPAALVRMSLAPAYGDAARLSGATVARYRDLLRAPGVRGAMLARMAQVRLSDPVGRLGRIAAPTLIVWGERDGMIPFSNAADYLRAIPRARLAALPGLGHVPFEEAPAAALAPVRGFLGGG